MLKALMFASATLFACSYLMAQNASKEYGGNGGSAFKDEAPEGERVAKITLRSGTSVDQIQFWWETGKSEQRGGNGGQPHTIELGKGEYIAKIVVYYDGLVDGLEFKILNKDNNSVRETVRYGNTSAKKALIEAPSGKAITGLFGRSGGKIDAIGFTFGNR